ncbi:MAG: hydroxymethylglutaryl-CoA lyase [Pseudonocardiales bacterium]|nr:hydroxymethylglutaryl-CoA lyase [Pseudonocardiales bacterium]
MGSSWVRERGPTPLAPGSLIGMELVLPRSVSIREVGMRDGLQIEAPVPLASKLAMIEALVATGVGRIEATSFVSPRAVPALADAEQVAEALSRWPAIRWSALVASPRGAHRAVAAGITDLEYVISAADAHSRANVGRSTAESIELVEEIVAIGHAAGGTVEVIIATAWDCPFTGPTPIERSVDVARQAVARGADVLCLGDTIGTTTPRRVLDLVDAVRAVAPGIDVGVHFHDTRGTGIANALAAIQAGVTSLDASVGGLGGCPFAPGASGNIATEELVYLLDGCGVESGIDLDALLVASAVTERAVGHQLPSSLYRAGGRPRPLGVDAAVS